jgi:hypothetical protein
MVRQIVTKHVSGEGNHTFEIHKVLSLELLNRGLLDCSSHQSRYSSGESAHCVCVALQGSSENAERDPDHLFQFR